MRAADVLVRGLKAAGTETIFALSGNQIMPVFDALLDSGIRLIHTRHEAATVYMAEAHAQMTGGVGIALVTAGGGLGNATGALIAAQASDTPVLLLSGDSPVAQDGTGAFQEMDQTGLTQTLTKGSRRVLSADALAGDLDWALALARSGRPGPVHLALPADVLLAQTDVKDAGNLVAVPEDPEEVNIATMSAAKRPLVVLGPALNETRAPGLALALQQALQAPVVVMESPRGLNDPALGRLADVARKADHILCIGKPVDFTLGFGREAHWPEVGIWDVVLGDDSQLDRTRRNLDERLGLAKVTDPRGFCARLVAQETSQPERRDWIDFTRRKIAERHSGLMVAGISPTDICRAVQAAINRSDAPVLVCDGGEIGQWAQAGLVAPRRIINGISGVIGGGTAYAMGAKAADPDATVFAMMGDGTVGFHLPEFETAVRAGLPFVAVVGNDRRWNAEHMIQMNSFGADRLIGCDLSGARYDQAVVALGGYGAHVTQKDQLDGALGEALQSGLPACINVEMVGFPAPTF